MKHFTCYLAGKMSGISFEESNEWRLVAKNTLESFDTAYKVTAINPNDYYNFKETRHQTEKEIIRFDLNKVRNSDLVFVNLDGDSIGTAMELMLAHELHIPIIGFTLKADITKIHPWIEYVCDRVFESMVEATDYILNYYLKE